LPEQVVRDDPIILPEINGDYGDFDDVLIPCQPFHEAVVQLSVRVQDEHSAFAIVPLLDVLTDEVFEKFRLARAGAATDIQMFVSFCSGKTQNAVSSCQVAENEVIAGGKGHRRFYHSFALHTIFFSIKRGFNDFARIFMCNKQQKGVSENGKHIDFIDSFNRCLS
jgi:hypothetical protein